MDALKLVDQIKARGVSKNTRQEMADETARLMKKDRRAAVRRSSIGS
jgi:hypothetical protein